MKTYTNKYSILLSIMLISSASIAQDFIETEVLLTRPPGHFFESIVFTSSGDMYVSEAQSHSIMSIPKYGDVSVIAQAKKGASFAGLAVSQDDHVYSTGRNQEGVQAVFKIVQQGKPELLALLPQAIFLNGAAFLPNGKLLVVDSKIGAIKSAETGQIYAIDVNTGTVSLYFEHPLLGKANPQNTKFPGVNGIKYYMGKLLLTNSERATVLSIELDDNYAPQDINTIATGVVGDDFAVAQDGDMYIATHPMNTLVQVTQKGVVTTIAQNTQGMTGATAAAFGRQYGDESALYVVTNGGSYIPPESGIETAKIVKINLHETGFQPFKRKVVQNQTQELFMVTAETVPGTEHLREAHGAQYAAYLQQNYDDIMIAGQVFENIKEAPNQRLYLIHASSAQAAAKFIEMSPYAQVGMYQNITAKPFRSMIGRWMQGVAWPPFEQ